MSDFFPMSPADLERLLPILLVATRDDRPPSRAQATAYLRHLSETPTRWQGWFTGTPAVPTAAALAVCPPDGTALVMTAPPGAFGIREAEQRALSAWVVGELRRQGVTYAQSLLHPDDAARRDVLEAAGFARLTGLIYLECDLASAPPRNDGAAVAWRAYDDGLHADLKQVIAESYRDSRDCPELTGLRPIDAVIAAHRAAGPFDPQLWQLAYVDDAPAGCVLQARIAATGWLEIVYLGVSAAHRRRGVGAALVRRALDDARGCGAGGVLVVVDERNDAARRLYLQFGFRPMLTRDALLVMCGAARELRSPRSTC